jgi:hypothetical protein
VFDFDLLSNASRLSEICLKGLTGNMVSHVSLRVHDYFRYLTLIDVTHDQSEVEDQMHEIHVDLSKLNNLQILSLLDCKNIKISGLNTEKLEKVCIVGGLCVFDFDISSNVSKLSEIDLEGLTGNMASLVSLIEHASLTELTLIGVTHDQSEVEGQTHEIPLDLSELNHLQILKMSDCKNIRINGLNTKELKEVHIINCKCVFDFDLSLNASKLSKIHLEGLTGNMTSLVSLVEHASLRNLRLKGVTHCQSGFEGQTHEIYVDLSKLNNLQILKLSDCKNIRISGLNVEKLE